MLTSLGFILLAGPAMAAICGRIGLPRIIGMLITGILLGPYALNLLDSSILSVSADLRQMALIIILLKAGLSLDLADLKKVGRPALMMACVPASFEILPFSCSLPGFSGLRRWRRLSWEPSLGRFPRRWLSPGWCSLWNRDTARSRAFPS